jgi:hypothetical protein
MRGMNQLLRENLCMFNVPVKSVAGRMNGFSADTQEEILKIRDSVRVRVRVEAFRRHLELVVRYRET